VHQVGYYQEFVTRWTVNKTQNRAIDLYVTIGVPFHCL